MLCVTRGGCRGNVEQRFLKVRADIASLGHILPDWHPAVDLRIG